MVSITRNLVKCGEFFRHNFALWTNRRQNAKKTFINACHDNSYVYDNECKCTGVG